MASPIQNFIESYFQVKQFQQREDQLLQQQRQFDAQQALAVRQQSAAEIGNFASLARNVRNPNELVAVADYLAAQSGDPTTASTLRSLAANIAPTMEAQFNDAMFRAGAPAADAALAISQGRQLSAGQELGSEQFNRTFDRNIFESDRSFGENIRQFNTSLAQDESQFGRQLGFNYEQLGQQDRLGQAGMMFSAGLGPSMLRGQLSQELTSINDTLRQQGSMMRPEARTALQRQAQDITDQMTRFDNMIQAEAMGGGGDFNQLYSQSAAAWQDVNTAASPGERQAAIERYNQLARQLGLTPLTFEGTMWGSGKAVWGGGQ